MKLAGRILGAVAGVALLYLLSAGPALRVYLGLKHTALLKMQPGEQTNRGIERAVEIGEAMDRFYRPVEWLKRSRAFENAFDWYLQLWEPSQK